jgi:hypothetical protein
MGPVDLKDHPCNRTGKTRLNHAFFTEPVNRAVPCMRTRVVLYIAIVTPLLIMRNLIRRGVKLEMVCRKSPCSWSGFRGLQFDSGPNQDKYAGLGWSDFAWVAGSLGCTSERVGLDGLMV